MFDRFIIIFYIKFLGVINFMSYQLRLMVYWLFYYIFEDFLGFYYLSNNNMIVCKIRVQIDLDLDLFDIVLIYLIMYLSIKVLKIW